VDRALAALADLGSLADTDVVDVLRLAIRVVWRWQTALRGRRATRPEQKSWYAMGWAISPRSAAERRRLVRSWSDRRDWAGLLRLAMDLPVRDAVVTRRWFSPWWRPAGERDRQAYSLLAQAKPSTLASAYEVLRQASSETVMLGGGNVCWPQAHVYVRPYLKTFPTPFEGLLDRVNRPQAQWTPADLSYIRGARSLAEEKAGILPLYDLVAACMEWRFATDAAPARSARSSGHT
jgi:hypothetical protein